MGEEALAAERHWLDGQAATIAARRQYIRDMAACASCGATLRLCDHLRATNDDPTAPDWFGCCASGAEFRMRCRHVEDRRLLDALLNEVTEGRVRTVKEAHPDPAQGPNLPGMAWLLDQAEWWYPHRRPAVRLAEMDKPHRYNAAQLLERKAHHLHATVGMRYIHDAPDDVWASFERENAVEWLRGQPLMKALRRGLPTGRHKLAKLQERARHWSTCPMRLRIEQGRPQNAVCTCIPKPAAEGGKPTAS